MKMKFLDIIVFLFFCITVHCQSINTEDELVFRKVYLDNGLLKSFVNNQDGYTCLYIDKNKFIRKMIEDYRYPESTFFIISTYSNKGLLERVLFSRKESEGQSLWGYCNKSKVNDSIYYNYEIQSMNDSKIEHVEFCTNTFIDILYLDIKDLTTQNKLLSRLNIDKLEIPDDAKLVRFNPPIKGKYAYVNSNNVNIRKSADLNSNIVIQVNVGTLVEIVNTYEQYNSIWYEIKFKEAFLEAYNEKAIYVNGDFLEPIESIQ
ncbi:SH3 domain-containing protein [Bacteroides sp. 519]|uniref:SH3 domain-containing protein n=1 Tax=Bacteroides sp. 519 TaxID=2302937 RepID=UPI0013D834C0|nr:SH3 domain-containing protein [Bacteroides sp. 519]NDV59676.1 SH3 domain-containing protein [Bacteroides sp. 519]